LGADDLLNRKFTFNWKVSLFTIVCLAVFSHLGIWQLAREDEKRDLIKMREARLAQPAISVSDLDAEGNIDGTPVRMTGYFDERFILLLDNRVLEGHVGFEVHHLFHDDAGGDYLVNRGFVAMGRTRDQLPEVSLPGVSVNIRGVIYQPKDAPYTLSKDDDLGDNFPVIVQQVDVTSLMALTGSTIFPYVIRLDERESGSLPRYWPDTVMVPAQHRGYAIQWFTMAIVVVLAWIFFSFRREETP
jgi:surfeit locus 1 family protein